MPGLMGRTMTILKAKWSKLLDHAEDPAETLDYSYEEQLRQLQNVKRGIADVTTAKKRLELQYTSHTEAGREARRPGAGRARGGPRGPRPRGADPQGGDRRASSTDLMQQGQQLEAQQQKLIEGREDAADEGRVLPDAEGSDQGAVLGRRGAGADRRGGDGHRRGDGRRRPGDPARQGQDRADAGAAPARSRS